jgi:hypothetical protein
MARSSRAISRARLAGPGSAPLSYEAGQSIKVRRRAAEGDDILTSDPGDLRVLAEAADVHVELIPV